MRWTAVADVRTSAKTEADARKGEAEALGAANRRAQGCQASTLTSRTTDSYAGKGTVRYAW
jgi:hypothetical protein